MIKAIVALKLLAFTQQFITFQLTLWSVSARKVSDGVCLFPHPLPQNVPNPYDPQSLKIEIKKDMVRKIEEGKELKDLLLIFSGLRFRWSTDISFNAQVENANSTSMEINAEIFSTLRAFEIRLFVVLIDSASQWAQVEKQSVDLTNVTKVAGASHSVTSTKKGQ